MAQSYQLGFNPTIHQAGYGTPQASRFGNAVMATPPLAQIAYYPTDPYKGFFNYAGIQKVSPSLADTIVPPYLRYTGVLPIAEQPLYALPQPWE